MNQYADMRWQTFGLHNISVSNGVWSATASNINGYSEIFPLCRGSSFKPIGDSSDREFKFWLESPNVVLGDCITLFTEADNHNVVFSPVYGRFAPLSQRGDER
jgi:hypothetical protein